MKLALKILGALLLILVLAAFGVNWWATSSSTALMSRNVTTHTADFPIPFPLSDEEIEESGLDELTAAQLALERAVERGEHLVNARYGCRDCHGANLGGGVMIDAAPMGTILGPNITTGEGSRTSDYEAADWDRIVRHGVTKAGTPSPMPAQDYQLMSDQELSDIVAYIESLPPVDVETPRYTMGPLLKVLLSTGAVPVSYDIIGDHESNHAELPPPAEVSIEFGRHLAGVCVGCHGATYAGGPIRGGDPAWAPAANLTPHADGLGSWSLEDFTVAMREGRRPDGTELLLPMSLVLPMGQNMTDTEIEAMWVYLQSVPAAPDPS